MDDWYDDEPAGAPREEPDCPPCMDSGFIGQRNCASCNPSRAQWLWWRLTWRFRWRRIRDWFRRSRSTDEAPF